MATWKKFQTLLFVDITKITGTGSTPDWARIGKSTIFDLTMNPQMDDFDFIEDENPTSLLRNYQPSMSQELWTLEGDKAFDAMYEYMYDQPTGDDAILPVLIVFPKSRTTENTFDAWQLTATVTTTNFNTVDEKILFDMNFNGTITKGTATVTGGVPSFTAA